jgi:transposase-like protein
MLNALDAADHTPKVIITDKLRAYLDGIELVFGAETRHIQSEGFSVEPNTNLIERFHGTLKARTKVMRGLKNKTTARIIMDGWLIHYNFFRPHEALGNKTLGQAAKATFPYDSWKDIVFGTHSTSMSR